MNLSAMLLAAGESRRMGRPKSLLPFGGKTVIETIVDRLLALRVAEVLIVLGHQHEMVRQRIESLPVQIVVNNDFGKGMLSSIQCGVRALSSESEGVLLCLIDQPQIPPGVFTELIASFPANPAKILVPVHQSRRGHPILLPSSYYPNILQLAGGSGLRTLLHKHPERVLEIPCDAPEVVRDMDIPEDYWREIAGLGSRQWLRSRP